MRRMLVTALTVVFVFTSSPGYAALPPGQTPSMGASDLRQQLATIPPGTVVEVSLRQKGSEKIAGKLGPVTGDGFEVQTVKSGKLSNQKVAFADVKSVKEKRGMSRGRKVLLVVLVPVGLFAVLYLIAVARSGSVYPG